MTFLICESGMPTVRPSSTARQYLFTVVNSYRCVTCGACSYAGYDGFHVPRPIRYAKKLSYPYKFN